MQKIRIDFDNPGLPQHISAVENDSQSRFFQATLYENGKAYSAPEGTTYSIMYSGFGPQNQGWYDTINDGAGKRAACAVSGNVVTCEIARQVLQVPGHVSIVLCVTTGKGYMHKSWPIECDCKNDRYDSTAEIQSFFYITQVSNADWNRVIQALEDLKNTIDPTLSLSGKAADAAKVGEAVGELKEDLDAIATQQINILETVQFHSGEYYGYESHNVLTNADFGRFELFNVKANKTYCFKNIFSNFSCIKYKDGTYSRIENTTTSWASGTFVPAQDGVVAITGSKNSSYKNTLFTLSEKLYADDSYESYLAFSKMASIGIKMATDSIPKTYYVEKNGSGDFTKLSDAIVTATKYMDSVVYLGDGTWDLIEEFGSDFFNNATGGGAPRSPARGLLLKNRIHIIGSSKSKIICNYTGDNAVIKEWFSVFNSDIYGFTLENITIEASNIRYIIHDERDSDTDSYINRYIDCHFKFDNSDNDTPGRTAQCIGGGLGIDGYIDINGGVFESIDTTKTGHICVVSYHNSAGANAKNHISIKNTYLKALGYFRINSYGESTEITECEITNCSMGRSVLIGHETGGSNVNMIVTQWNNEIR